jgi:hypothetical protein
VSAPCNDALVGRRDQPRLLHRRRQRGYTDDPSLAMFSEPEAVGANVQRDLTARSHRVAHEALHVQRGRVVGGGSKVSR